MGILADIYSGGNTLKRRMNALIQDPAGALGLGATRFGEDQNQLINLMRNAYPMQGERTVLNSPQQMNQFRGELADKGAEQAMAGMFVGPGSKTWDALQAAKAAQLEKQGLDPRKIWSETGTWKGPDGMWRQEIPDNAPKITDEVFYGIKENQKFQGPMRQALPHNDLYAAYPDAGDINSGFYAWKNPEGSYDRLTDTISAGGPGTVSQKSSALHELQHAIQQREGFAKGGNPESMEQILRDLADQKYKDMQKFNDLAYSGDPLNLSDLRKPGARKKALKAGQESQDYRMQAERINAFPELSHDAYKRLSGEAEARATQARIPLDAAQRRATFPADSYDVPMNQLIIRGLLK